MALTIARVGDKTSHGGVIVQGSTTRKVGGRQVARKGDKCTCPIHGATTIVKVDPKMPETDGRDTAHAGAMTACGARILPSNGSKETQGSGH